MAKEIRTEILIHAKPENVWNILSGFNNYSDWNPFIKSIEGNIQVGKTFTVRIQPPNRKGMTFKPKVLAYEINREFRWIGKLLVKGLFDGEHKFELVDNKNGTTTFIQSEKFSGILVPFLGKMLDGDTKDGFIAMNKKLKEITESK